MKTNRKEMQETKQWLKDEAKVIRVLKKEMKNAMRTSPGSAWKLQSKLIEAKMHYRWNHISYSMARGKTYEQIEITIRKDNEPNWSKIDSILIHKLSYVLFDDKTVKPIYEEQS